MIGTPKGRRARVVVPLLAIVLLLGWLLLAGNNSTAALVPQAGASDAVATQTAAPEAAGTLERATDEAAGQPDEAMAGPARTADAAGKRKGQVVTILVRDGKDGPPVPDCPVWAAGWQTRRDLPEDPDGWIGRQLVEHTEAHRTGPDGRVDLEVVPREPLLLVHARFDDRVGSLQIPVGQSVPGTVHELVLRIDHTLRVRVVDARGAPAADVGVRVQRKDGGVSVPVSSELRTDAQGTVLVHELDHLLVDGKDEGLQVSAAIAASASRKFDTLPPPGSEVTLELPPTGTLHVLVDAPPGVIVDPSWYATVWTVYTDPDSGAERNTQSRRIAFDRTGTVRVPWITIGNEIRVSVSPGWMSTGVLDLPPLTHEGEVREVRVPVLGDSLLVEGRLVTPDGPLETDRMGITIMTTRLDEKGEPQPAFTIARADASGTFFAVFDSSWMAGKERDLRLRVAHAGRTYWASLATLLPLRPGYTRLGDLRVIERELLVRGRVVLAPDAPCDGYSVTVEHLPPGGDGTKWQNLHGGFAPSVEVAIDGTNFEVRGDPPTGPLRLRVRPNARCHVPPPPIPFARGMEDLVVRLERGGTLTVHLTAPEDFGEFPRALAPLLLVALPVDGRAAEEHTEGLELQQFEKAEGHPVVHTNGVLPGTYAIEIMHGTHRLRVGEVRIRAEGSPYHHAYVDLGAYVRHVELTARTVEGEKPAYASVEPIDGPGAPVYWRNPSDGPLRLAVLRDGIDVRVSVMGIGPIDLRSLAQDRKIELRAWAARVQVAVRGLDALPDGLLGRVRLDYRVDASLAPNPFFLRHFSRTGKLAAGRADIEVARAGTYGWTVELHAPPDGGDAVELASGALDLADGDVVSLTPAVDAARLAEAVASLRR